MDLKVIVARLQRGWRVAILVSLGAVTCACIPIFLAAASFVLLFITVPIFLVLGAPTQLTLLLLDSFSSSKRTAPIDSLQQIRNRSSSRGNEARRTASKRSASSKGTSPAPGSTRTAPRSDSRVSSLPRTPHSILRTPTNLSVGSIASTFPASRLEPEVFVESPLELFQQEIPTPLPSPLEALSGELIEEIVRHLPQSSIGTLALVSKRFGTQFRFRRMHSGTEDCSLPKFALVKQEPRLGEYTTQLIIHPTFFRPPAKVQWLLEGSDHPVSNASWTATEEKKQGLLAAVLRACPRTRSLIWNEGKLPVIPSVLESFGTICSTSLRHLDVAVGSALINYINEHMTSNTLRLDSLTLRGGFAQGSSSAIIGLLSICTTIRHVQFLNADFGASPEDAQLILTAFLQKPSPVLRVDFIEPVNLDTKDIPIAHTSDGLQLTIQHPTFHSDTPPHTPPNRFGFLLPGDSILSNVTAFVFWVGSDSSPGAWGGLGPNLEPGLPSLSTVVSASTNLRVFSLNARVSSSMGGWGGWGPALTTMPQDLVRALTSKSKLISLSLMSLMMTRDQLQVVCEFLPQLLHLGILMNGEPIQISTYSQYFSNLTRLVALDVVLTPLDLKCSCGHEADPRIPHQEEGSAMGRLCRRFRSPIDLAVVRLCQNAWPPATKESNFSSSELRWIGSPELAMKTLERICGPCETNNEAAHKVFDPTSWLNAY